MLLMVKMNLVGQMIKSGWDNPETLFSKDILEKCTATLIGSVFGTSGLTSK